MSARLRVLVRCGTCHKRAYWLYFPVHEGDWPRMLSGFHYERIDYPSDRACLHVNHELPERDDPGLRNAFAKAIRAGDGGKAPTLRVPATDGRIG